MPSLHSEAGPPDLRPVAAGPSLWWLGQAGFALWLGGRLVLIDPYLSNALAEKYAGRVLPHQRMMAAPVRADDLPQVDLVLITHRHGDHLDRPTLATIAARWTECVFVVPAAEAHQLAGLGIAAGRIAGVRAFEPRSFGALVVHPVPAAHETLERDEQGRHRYLGYVLDHGGVTLYHSGDCVPYAGLDEALAPHRIGLALLPVNGRDSHRAALGVPGNFTLDEAIALCRTHGIPTMIAHHFGMFAFNTLPLEVVEKAALDMAGDLELLPAKLDIRYDLGGIGRPSSGGRT